MGSKDEFGPDTESIRAWLDKRSTYARDARVVGTRGGEAPAAAPGPSTPPRPAPGTTTADRADSLRAGRSVLEALGVDSPPDPPSRIAQAGGLDSTDLGRSVVEALRADMPRKPGPAPRPAPPTAAPHPDPHPDPEPVEVEATAPVRPAPPPHVRSTPEVKHGRWTEPEDNLTALNASTDAQFPVRGGIRRALSWMLLAVLAGTGAASYAAARNPTATTLAIAATLGFLTLVAWAVRAGCTTTELAVRRGQLSIRRNGQTEVVDLASAYTPIAIVGEPSDRRWTVLIERPGLPLVVITRSMVDPHWFTTVLYRLRPGLRPDDSAAEPVTQP